MNNDCEKIQGKMADYILGILSAEEVNVIDEHAGECLKCRQYKQALEDENRILLQFGDNIRETITARQEKVIEALKRSTPTVQIEKPSFWRIIMKSKITKLATAAVIIIAAIYGLTTILDRSATPSYAVEQTIEAFKNVNTVYYVMAHRAEDSTETWARRGRDGKFWMGDYRMQSTGGMTIVANESKNVTYKYNEIEKILHIYKGITDTTGGWLDIDFYELLRDEMKDVNITQVKDKHSGKDCISITFKVPEKYKGAGRSGVILFDIESKLPARMTMWSNDNFDDEPLFEITKMIYNPEISEEVFDFEIPEGATVIEQEQD